MNALDSIKNKILKLYKNDPNVHVNVDIPSPRVNVKNEPVLIKGVYPHIFQVEERSTGTPKTYTVQYGEVLLGHVEILEMK